MARLAEYIHGSGLMARILRSASWITVGYGAGQALRLASNLILTRILFPEAFGLMALVTMVTIGLALFSDLGIFPAISQSKRGDDPDFLNTAWTLQIIRGVVLFALTWVLAGPIADFYDEPLLASYLPVAGLSLLILGLQPTRVATAQRHLAVGRVTALDLTSQVIGLAVMIALAWATRSVFALVLGTVIQALVLLILNHAFLPGEHNRLRWDRSAVTELFGFGKWIFLSTAFFFFTTQGDKAVLGKYLHLDLLGIYNIGYFLASFPIALGITLAHRMLIPIYRERPPRESPENFRKLARMRHVATSGLVTMLALLAFGGPWLVGQLYDDRYLLAGGIVTLIAAVKMIQAVGVTYDNAALAAGDSRQYFVFNATRATLQVGFLLIGVTTFGLVGAIVGFGLALICAHPVLIWLARSHHVWDPRHDLLWFGVVLVLSAAAIWMNFDAIRPMIGA
ncbi:oligosaccharide flippase family protein [Aestuariivita boseongensis]|uniref:oligosaccharide flippase family protein n=1 Tax=Aestuariivita boseongensis TaxID=1470562 RepID=UPI0006815CB8|nr:oligosaccharide flippase family protein [Aestuariivita boseongensis]